MRWQQLILVLAPAFACVTDASLTLYGQPAEYWAGDTSVANEMSPEPRKLLAISPAIFLLAVVGWISALAFLVVCTRRLTATVLSCSVTIAHASGAATWILWSLQYGYQLTILLQLVSGTILAISICHVMKRPHKVSRYLLFPAAIYRATVFILLCAILFMFLVPH
ncbi:MAG: hypothetical protein KDA85_19375 [Planctomycetaceae bacterium]|nr:hypothetical protein [Planctomycetaceae bacterium]